MDEETLEVLKPFMRKSYRLLYKGEYVLEDITTEDKKINQ